MHSSTAPDGAPGMIFDLDGTLVSSSLDFKRIRHETGCPASLDLLTYIDNLRGAERDDALRCVQQHEARDAQSCVLLPGVANSLQWLRENGVATAVVTRNSRSAAAQKLSHVGLHFEIVLTREDAPAKPDPEALFQVAKAWGLPAERCVYVGDFRYDIEAALAASMQAWLYAPGTLPDYAHRAHYVLRDFSALPAAVGRLQQGMTVADDA